MMLKVLNFPPSWEQLRILSFWGVNGDLSLLVLRIATWIILLFSLWQWGKLAAKKFNNRTAFFSIFFLIISPTVWVVGLMYPMTAILMLMGVMFFSLKGKWFWLGVVVIPTYSVLVLGYHPAIFNKVFLRDAQTEVNNRFMSEDSLREKINLPLWWRRASDNKYFLVYKQTLGEFIQFLDLETIFFAEVTPTGEKSVVIFYWPEIFLMILGLIFLVRDRDNRPIKYLGKLFILAWVSYVFSEGASYLRLTMVLWPISLILATAMVRIYRWIMWVFILIIGYGWMANVYDINVRPDYWLDNRPLAFQFWYTSLKEIDLNQFKKVMVTSRIGDAKKYCYFYLGKRCDQDKFKFDGFDLSVDKVESKSIYAGFSGEFVGSRFKNDISSDWQKMISDRGFDLVKSISLRDTIAYKYGNDIGLIIKND